MNSYLAQLIGRTVNVWSGQGQHEVKDTGTLLAVDYQWVVIQKDGEQLFFSIANVRLVKPQ